MGILYKKYNVKIVTAIVLSILFMVLINTSYNFFNPGSLDGLAFENPHLITRSWYKYFIDLLIMIIGFILIMLIYRLPNIIKNINKLLVVLNISIVSISVYFAMNINSSLYDLPEVSTIESDFREVLGFSKKDKNILILMLDAASGSHVSHIFNLEPSLKDSFDGFVNYKDTTALGNFTITGEACIHGGYDYSPKAINSRSQDVLDLKTEISLGYSTLINSFAKHNFSIELMGTQYSNCGLIKKINPKANVYCKELESYEKQLYNHRNQHTQTKNEYKYFLASLGVFNTAPYSLRSKIYNKGRWNKHVDASAGGKYLYVLNDLDRYLNTDKKGSSIKYLQVSYAHRPWILGRDSCKPVRRHGLDTREYGMEIYHLDQEYCAFKQIAKMNEWLIENDVYNNTMIILVSDHSKNSDPELSKVFGIDIREKNAKKGFPGQPSALLMVKDFDSDEPFIQSDNPMSNADTLAIACSAIGGCNGGG